MGIQYAPDEGGPRPMRTADDDRQARGTGLAVATICAGREGHLRGLVRGVARSDDPPDELIVVGIGETVPAIDAGAVAVRTVEIETSARGLPLARARNVAAVATDCDHLLMLDVDCIPSPGLVGHARTTLAAADVIAMATVRYLPAGPIVESDFAARATTHPSRPVDPEPMSPARSEHFWSLAYAVRRATALDRIGGFDPAYVGYGGEDTDFALKAERAGVPIVWLGGPPAYHQHHRSLSPPVQHLAAIVRNAVIFQRKWGRWPMEGWLAEFAARGLVSWEPENGSLELLRELTPEELESGCSA